MNKVVEDFHTKIQNDIQSYDDRFYETKIQGVETYISTKEYEKFYRLSKIFKKFVKNVDLTNIMNANLIKNMFYKYTNDPYISELIKPCFISSIRFKRLLMNNNLYSPYLVKEFMISFYIIILYIPIGKIQNLKLFESIQSLWMIIDNIIDNKDTKNKKLLKHIFKFLKDEIYEDSPDSYIMKHKNDLCMSIVLDIYKNEDLKDKKEFFRDVRKLLFYSYTKQGIQNENSAKSVDILHVSMTKSYLSHRLFRYCIPTDIDENENFFYLCLISQLSDDMMDMGEDLSNHANTLFTNSNRRERSIITLSMLDIIIEKFPNIKHYLILSILDAVLYNKHLHDPEFIQEIIKYGFIDTKLLDFQEIEKIVFEERLDEILDQNLINVFSNEFIFEDDKQLEIRIQAISNNSTYI